MEKHASKKYETCLKVLKNHIVNTVAREYIIQNKWTSGGKMTFYAVNVVKSRPISDPKWRVEYHSDDVGAAME